VPSEPVADDVIALSERVVALPDADPQLADEKPTPATAN
jgi:hypothetical protein